MIDDRIEGTAKKFAGSAQQTYGNIVGDENQQIKGAAKKAAGSLQDAFGKADDFVHDSIDSVHSSIKDKPVQSTLVALLIGLVIGKLYL